MALLGFFLKGVGLKILGAVAIAGTVAAILLGARQSGRTAERVEGLHRTLKSVEKANEIERDVMRAGGDDARRRLLDKWARD